MLKWNDTEKIRNAVAAKLRNALRDFQAKKEHEVISLRKDEVEFLLELCKSAEKILN